MPQTIPRVRAALAVLALLALLAGGCLGTLRQHPDAASLARAPEDLLDVPNRVDRPSWLLRRKPGWVGAHEVEYGGTASDHARTVIQAVVFVDTATAAEAYARLTPEYLRRLRGERMDALPKTAAPSVPIPADEIAITEYPLKMAPEDPDAGKEMIVQLITLRAGRTVVVIDSIGYSYEDLAPAVAELVRAGRSLKP